MTVTVPLSSSTAVTRSSSLTAAGTHLSKPPLVIDIEGAKTVKVETGVEEATNKEKPFTSGHDLEAGWGGKW